ncbi:uncharacterized protein Dwil_GK18459 [Drosophila willistoni]|uniref:Major facilitator superfamily (MFS) profile domain-containing protein n=1 Tax=Drosophila willistoni TaxID=7260 RepID=B4NLR7_DROWI|nr:facilitated trehalose transporter Tret1 [Drosophila willistoni]EDW85306.1 uncharacterized protein Dwil_GK18459 [Drosophila willistoni]
MFFENSLLQARTRYQLIATVLVNIITFTHGVGVGWLSPTLTKISSSDSPLDFHVNIDEISWMGSMLGLGSMCGNLTIAFLLERLGRKFCIYLLAAPNVCLWILIYSASNVGFLYAARFLCGFTGGAGYSVLPIFISEIADSSIRGALSSMVMLSVNLGILAGFILSSHLSYQVVPLLAICLPVLYFLTALLLPETPSYLLRHSRQKEAEKSLRFYKNPRENDEEQSFKMDFEELRSNIAAQQASTNERLSFRDLLTKPALKGFASAMVLTLGHQCSGIFSFVNYMSTVFAASGSVFDVNTCTIIIGVFQIIGVYTSTMCVDIIGRRILMLISTFGIGLGCILFGFFTYYAQQYDLSRWNWIPLVLMIILVYLANVGLNGLIFLVLVELFPAKIRSLATSISLVFLSAIVFGTLKLFPLMLHYLGISVTMWFSGCSCFITFLYFFICLPETKGKSMIVD